MIDHLSLGVDNITAGCDFYDKVLACVGAQRLATFEHLAAYGVDKVEFLLILPHDGATASAGNGCHIAFSAPDQDSVKRFHTMAINLGASCEGAPGIREAYPKADVFAAYLRDPFGNKVEVLHNGFSQ